jgi:site-specific DNA-methyltransferase (adenine-specific)
MDIKELENKIIHADCMDILKQLPDKCVDCIITDPPYGINYENNDWDKNFNIKEVMELCTQKIKDNGNIIIFQGWSNVCETKQIMDKYWNIQNWIIWDRIKGRGALYNFTSTREDILWYCNGNKPTFNKIYSNIKKMPSGFRKNKQDNRSLSNVWYDISPIVAWGKEKIKHPTQKPIKLIERLVKIFSNENDLILDCFSGSGTTAVACHNLKRRFICIEKDEDYYKASVERLQNAQAQQKLF